MFDKIDFFVGFMDAAWFILCSMSKGVKVSDCEVGVLRDLSNKFSEKQFLCPVDVRYIDLNLSRLSDLMDRKDRKDLVLPKDILRFVGRLRFVKGLSESSVNFVKDFCARVECNLSICEASVRRVKALSDCLAKSKRDCSYIERIFAKTFIINNRHFLNITKWELENRKRLAIRKFVFIRVMLQILKKDISLEYIDRLRFAQLMISLPLNSVLSKISNMCILTGRTRSVNRITGTNIYATRELLGFIPGLIAERR